MMNDRSSLSDDELRRLLESCQEVLTSVVQSLANRPDMQNAICRLMSPDDMLDWRRSASWRSKEPDMMRLVLQACLATLVNVQSVMAADADLKRRAVWGN